MTTRPLHPPVVAVVATVLALLATVLAVTVGPVGSARAAGPGSDDYVRMPGRCVAPGEKIPSTPVVCRITRYDERQPTVVVWGDSHAWMLLPAVSRAVQSRGINVLAVLMGSCPPMDNRVAPDDAAPACFRSNALGLRLVRRLEASGRPYRVVLAASWQRYLRALRVGDDTSYVGQMALAMREGTPRLARTLESLGAGVDLVGQVATVPTRRPGCAGGDDPYLCALPRRQALPDYVRTRDWAVNMLRPALDGRAAINVNAYFCSRELCRGRIGETRTWFDELHLSTTMARLLSFHFAATVDAVDPPLLPPGTPGIPPCTMPWICAPHVG